MTKWRQQETEAWAGTKQMTLAVVTESVWQGFSGREDHTPTAADGRGPKRVSTGPETPSYSVEPRCFLLIGPISLSLLMLLQALKQKRA